jgi:hypothetical protein
VLLWALQLPKLSFWHETATTGADGGVQGKPSSAAFEFLGTGLEIQQDLAGEPVLDAGREATTSRVQGYHPRLHPSVDGGWRCRWRETVEHPSSTTHRFLWPDLEELAGYHEVGKRLLPEAFKRLRYFGSGFALGGLSDW